MPISTLIDPSNRLLGWSTNDFSLYGGQPTVAIGAPPVSSDDSLVAPTSGDGSDAPAGNTTSELAPVITPDSPSTNAETDTGTAPAALVSAPQTESLTAPGLAFSSLSSDAQTAPNLSPIGLQSITPGSAAARNEAVDTHSGAGSLTPSDVASIGPTISPLTAQVVHLQDTLAAHVDHATEALSTITTTLGATLDPVINTLDRIGDDGLGLLTGDHGALSLSGLAGTDPAAGITTLTSMLDSVDAFAVAPEGGGSALFASTGPVLDLLTDDAPHALLGDIAHHDDGLLPLDHHDGGLGLL